MNTVKPYMKAIVGAATAGLTAAGTALADGTITGPEWVGIALAVVGAFGIVYAVPNTPESGNGGA